MRRGRGLIGPLFACLLLVLAARRWLDVVEVRGQSMAPSLLPGDRLLAVRLGRRPRRGEIVLVPDPREPSRELIKRVARLDRTGILLRGDNRARSTDGRAFGAVRPGVIRWRIALRYWPPDRIGLPPAHPGSDRAIEDGGEGACTFPQALVAGSGHDSAS